MNFINRLDEFAAARHETLTNNEEKLKLNYSPSFEYNLISNDTDIDEIFNRVLNESKAKEIMRGTTLFGPHRDDLDIVLNGESTKIFGSQGQQRTAALSMKLAEIDLMKEESGEYPVLLLDDVLSELDDRRKEYLLDSIGEVQAFITCTDRRFFNRSPVDTKFLYIENGEATEPV
jgi:DNA replication and repair protein RecF